MRGSAPRRERYWRGFAPRRENDFAGLGAPNPDMRDRDICGALPHTPTVRELYMRGFTPHPEPRWDLSHLADLFWEKVPETRKNRTG